MTLEFEPVLITRVERGDYVLMERCATGDRIPLHRHDVDEVVIVVEGDGEYHLAGEVQHVAARRARCAWR